VEERLFRAALALKKSALALVKVGYTFSGIALD
jgi:hypothetical protein